MRRWSKFIQPHLHSEGFFCFRVKRVNGGFYSQLRVLMALPHLEITKPFRDYLNHTKKPKEFKPEENFGEFCLDKLPALTLLY